MEKVNDKIQEKAQKRFVEDLVKEVKADFAERQKNRKSLERSWELNMNFLSGNQYCDVNSAGDLEEEESRFFWQSRKVYNHIAPTIDTRCAKLARVRPELSVRANSDEDGDLKTAKLSANILKSTYQKIGLDKIIQQGTMWCEVCGSVFYKISWDDNAGKKVGVIEGKPVYEGEIKVSVCPSFEIFPDSLSCENIDNLTSLIHAKALPVTEIERLYGLKVAGRDIDEFTLSPYSMPKHDNYGYQDYTKTVKRAHEIVIEKYENPTVEFPNGRLIIVVGDNLVYYGGLPYVNGERSKRIIPFVKQNSIDLCGSFFGASVIDRMIPIQRAYNAVKNRKHEFLNRLSMGVMTVEDGSIDTDELADEGLCPGKILVYRQGATPPKMMDCGEIPSELKDEEDKLINEFVLISGISEVSRTSTNPTNVTSGTGLQLLIEQDDARLSTTADNVRNALKDIAKQILRLYKQFATDLRMAKMTGEGKGVQLYYFKNSDISSDDVMFDTENELNNTPAQKRSMIHEIYNMGLLNDENGKLSDSMRLKILESLGFGSLDNSRGVSALHITKAEKENIKMLKEKQAVDFYDDHTLHINEHTRFLLSSEFEKYNDTDKKQNYIEHLKAHKKYLTPEEFKVASENE